MRLERRDERVEERALLLRERRAQVLRDHVLAGAVAQAPGERLGVPHADAGVAERTGVLVDAEREDRRLERRDRDLPLGEDPDHRRRQGSVLRQHEVVGLDPVRRLPGVVVEDDDLDVRIARDVLELAQALRRGRSRPRSAAGSSSGRLDSPRADRARRHAGGRTPCTFRLWEPESAIVAPGYSRRAASIAPSASKSVFVCETMTSTEARLDPWRSYPPLWGMHPAASEPRCAGGLCRHSVPNIAPRPHSARRRARPRRAGGNGACGPRSHLSGRRRARRLHCPRSSGTQSPTRPRTSSSSPATPASTRRSST